MAEDGWRSLIEARRAWSRLPWRRRRALWTKDAPRDAAEAETARGFARYLRSPMGDVEWALSGLVGVLLGYAVLQFLTLDSISMTGRGLAGWVAAWTFVGLYLRRWRASDIEPRAGADPGGTS